MRLGAWVVSLVLMFVAVANATLTIHIQSPWRNDATKSGYYLHILGGAGGGYNPSFGASSSTITTDEGDGWFSYTWDKNVSDFQDWQSFTVSIYPNTEDNNYNNNNGTAWKEAGDFKISAVFGSDNEVWLYTDPTDMSYTKSFVAPGSKMVWFKSPWGNKALPQMIFGQDSVLMRFAQDDKTKCGWFYGAISPAALSRNAAMQTATFMRLYTPYMTWPAGASVDLKDFFAVADTVYIDGTSSVASVTLKMGSLGTCFDSTRTLHVYHPWRANTTYKDSAMFLSVGNNILNNPTRMLPDEYDRWWIYNFDNATVNSSNWMSNGARVEFYRKQNEWPQVVFFSKVDSLRPLISEWFPKGVYETWIYTKDNGAIDVLYSPLEPKYVRVKSPWDNMSPMLILPKDTIKMGPYSDDSSTCGWYQGIVYKHTEDWNIYLRQAFGMTYADAKGQKESNTNLTLFDIGEYMALADTVYVMPSPTLTSPLKAYFDFPNSPGNCPQLVLNVRIVDWAGEGVLLPGATSSQQTDFSIDVDFGGIYNGNDYTTVTYLDSTGALATNSKCGGLVLGMVNDYLYTDTILVPNSAKASGYDTLFYKIPTRVDSLLYPWGQCSAAHEIERWFIPDTVKSANGNYIAATCYQIPMTLDEEGFWLVDISEDSPNEGFFPLDDFKYLDDEKTVWNPKFDSTCIEGHCHNYSFAMKIAAQFQYVKGQYFEFRGDDDVWVFINDRLVVDIGGCHSPEEGGVYLDTIGQNDPSEKLIEGKTYSFYIFFSERNATGSNFKMRTSINLQTEKTYYYEEYVDSNGVSTISLLQRMVDKNMSCDEGSVAQAKVMNAPSYFILKHVDGTSETLEPGNTYYGGITINLNGSSFVLDTAALSAAHESGSGLPEGNYTLQFCKEDLSECDSYSFVIKVPKPTIAFADSLGNIIDPEKVTLGVYANIFYPVYVKVLYRGKNCYSNMCLAELALSSPDSMLSFYSASMNATDKVSLTKTVVGSDTIGLAMFYVMSMTPVEDASFHVAGASDSIENELDWLHINLQKAPVPPLRIAEMFDRDGDGIGDSMYVSYEDMIRNDDKWMLDTLSWFFGDSSVWHRTETNQKILEHTTDSTFTLVGDSLYESLFTGATGSPYKGTVISSFRYFDKNDSTGAIDTLRMALNGSIVDRVPPMISRAVVVPRNEGKMVDLTIYLTESLDTTTRKSRDIFDFRVYFDGLERSSSMNLVSVAALDNGAVLKWVFSKVGENDVAPAVGDSIRLSPGIAMDLSGNYAHRNNRWVRIEGEQELRVDVVKYMEISNDLLLQKKGFSAVAMPSMMPLAQMQEKVGMPGFCIRYDMSELLLGDTTGLTPEDIEITWETNVFTNLGMYVNNAQGTISCADSIFDGDCRKSGDYIFIAWNGTSSEGRLISTGAYIYKYKVKLRSKKEKVNSTEDTKLVGIRRIRK